MTITTKSNGSKWYGENPDSIEELLKVLASEPLDRTFERFGNFAERDPKLIDGGRREGVTRLFGNFFTCSHVFNIDVSNDDPMLEPLLAAIHANQQRPDYLAQPSAEEQQRAIQERIEREYAARMEWRRSHGFRA